MRLRVQTTAPQVVQVGARVDRPGVFTQLRDAGDRPLLVAKVNAVAPQTNLVINTERLYDGVGNVFSKQQLEVTTVQLQTEDGLYDLLGPVAE